MANDISLDTLQNNKKKTQVIMYMLIALIMIALGATFMGTGTTAALIAGGIGIVAGGYFGYTGYNILIDPKNERRCKQGYFTQVYSNMRVPKKWVSGDVSIDTDIDMSEEDIITKAQFNGYGGVFLVSNISGDSVGGNYDAYYVPGDIKSVLTRQLTNLTTVGNTQQNSDGDTIAWKLYIAADYSTNVRVTAKTDESNTNTRKEITTLSGDSTKQFYSPVPGGCPYS